MLEAKFLKINPHLFLVAVVYEKARKTVILHRLQCAGDGLQLFVKRYDDTETMIH